MMTVKEIAEITNISARTLHYYDEIGLLKPTAKSEAGYRLYDDKALETLQQILFFREFDIPLKEIKSIIASPTFDRNKILQMQRKMLAANKERIERLIASIDDTLEGENKMDFSVFSKKEMEEMFHVMFEHMPENIKELSIKEFGSAEEWKQHYLDIVSSKEMQERYAKVVEWYGSKEAFLSFTNNPISEEVAESFNKRIDLILRKLLERKELPMDSFEFKEIIAEYGFVMKMLYQIKDEKQLMLSVAESYRNELVRNKTDETYGAGASDFFAMAIESFYE